MAISEVGGLHILSWDMAQLLRFEHSNVEQFIELKIRLSSLLNIYWVQFLYRESFHMQSNIQLAIEQTNFKPVK